MNRILFRSIRIGYWFCFTTVIALALEPAQVSAADADQNSIKATVVKSMEALWIGTPFDAGLMQQQQELRHMLEAGSLSKARLETMIKETVPGLIREHKTSRYYLQEISARIDMLFASHIKWETIKAQVWQEMASFIPDGEQMVLRVGTLAPQGTPWLNVPEKILIPRMEKLSGGKVTLKLYGGGVMGEDVDILRKIDIGQLDVCGATTLGMLAASPETAVFMLPGLFNNYEEIDYIYETFRKRIDKGFEEKGYILAALIDTGHYHIFSKKRIDSLAELKRQKVLTCWGTVESAMYNELRIRPIPVAVPEVMSALSTGLADTTLAPSAWMLGMQAYQSTNFYITPPVLFSPAVVIMGVRAVDRFQRQFGVSDIITHNVQEILVFEVNLVEREWRSQIRTYGARALEAFRTKTGMKAVTLSDEDQAAIAQAGLRVREKLAGNVFSEDLMNDVLNTLEAYREKLGQP